MCRENEADACRTGARRMKDKRRERKQAIRLMDIQNERLRWMYTAGSKEKDGRRKVREQIRERRMGEEHMEGIEREIDGSDGGNKRKTMLRQKRRGWRRKGEMNGGLQ